MQITLRERNRYARFTERRIDRKIQITHDREAPFDTLDTDSQLEIERAVAEAHK